MQKINNPVVSWRNQVARTYFGASLALFASSSFADLTVTPIILEELAVTDNRRLVANPVETIYGSITELFSRFEHASETQTFDFTPRARITRYTGEQDFNTDEFFLSAGGTKLFERFSLSGRIRFDRTSTLTSEAVDDLGLVADGGLIIVNRNRDEFGLDFESTYAINERNLVSTQFRYSDVSFEEAEASGLSEFDFASGSVTYTHQYSPQLRLLGTVGYSRFESIQNFNVSKTLSATIGRLMTSVVH